MDIENKKEMCRVVIVSSVLENKYKKTALRILEEAYQEEIKALSNDLQEKLAEEKKRNEVPTVFHGHNVSIKDGVPVVTVISQNTWYNIPLKAFQSICSLRNQNRQVQVEAIKVLRYWTNLSLIEAKEFVENSSNW